MPFFFVIIQYSVYEINARAAKFHIKVLCLFLHSVLDRDRDRERERIEVDKMQGVSQADYFRRSTLYPP